MSGDVAVYKTQCRSCNKTVSREFPITKEFVNSKPEKRIRCSKCHTTNYVKAQEQVQ